MDRIAKLRSRLPQDFTAALVTDDISRHYLLQFDAGDAGVLLIFPEASYYIIDSRYIEVANRDVKDAKVELETNRPQQLRELLAKHGAKRLMVENTLSLAGYTLWQKELAGVELVTGDTLTDAIQGCRCIKEESEWKDICTAQSITDAAFTYILERIEPGRTERELAAELEYFMRKNGAARMAFETILITGAKTSMPHGVPGEEKVKKGDFITMDYGANYNGYCLDMTRTVAVDSVTEEMKNVYDTVLKAQLACCAAAKAGQVGKEVDKIARDIIYQAGYEGCFGHGLGHSLGLEIHEKPGYSMKSEAVVQAGTIMTIEPGIYLAGKFGVRIEDTVLVQENGIVIPGNSPKELIIL